jgi:hypothetical protein
VISRVGLRRTQEAVASALRATAIAPPQDFAAQLTVDRKIEQRPVP